MAAKKEIKKAKKGNRLNQTELKDRIALAVSSGQSTAKWCLHLQATLNAKF